MNSTTIVRPLAAFAAAALLLAGCTPLSGKQQGGGENLSQSIQDGIGRAVSGVETSVREAAQDIKQDIKANALSAGLDASQDIGSAVKVTVNNEVGDITVVPVSGNTLSARAQLYGNTSRLAGKWEELVANTELSVRIEKGSAIVAVHPKGNVSQNLWSWAQKQYGFSDFSIDYIIDLPEEMNDLQLTTEVGDLDLSGLNGRFDIKNSVGEIRITDTRVTGSSSVASETGSITLSLSSLGGEGLEAKTSVGSIVALLPDSLSSTVTARTEVGTISGISKGTSELNGGGTPLKLTTEVGSIKVEQGPH